MSTLERECNGSVACVKSRENLFYDKTKSRVVPRLLRPDIGLFLWKEKKYVRL